ncbi:MAG TPA: hypothetical protein P5524_00490 [Candidatus Paceibacterota bacterium]|nr:hypothetical protein [Candidatus Paceibacterota bacterium]
MSTKNDIEKLYIDVPRALLQERAQAELGRLLTEDEIAEVAQFVVDAAFAAISDGFYALTQENNE